MILNEDTIPNRDSTCFESVEKNQNKKIYKCDQCEKIYMSEVARNNHKKNKHSQVPIQVPSKKKGKLRPGPLSQEQKQEQKILFNEFFLARHRRRNLISDINADFLQSLKSEIKKLRNSFEGYIEFSYIDDYYPFIDSSKSNNCEGVFYRYLSYVFDKCSQEYFGLVIKFTIFFREFLNLFKGRDYTFNSSITLVPKYFNEFMFDYMIKYNFFEMPISELIGIIHHFSYWLYLNGFSHFTLSIIKK